jgi:anti-anti-sigma factor
MLALELHMKNGVVLLRLDGPLDGGPSTEAVHEEVKELVAAGYRRFLVDMVGVPWVNSLGLGVLIASYSTCVKAGAVMKVCCPSHRAERCLKVARLMPVVFPRYGSCEEAMLSFG